MDARGLQAVFFDAAGTLFETRGSVGEIYGRVAARYGIAADPLQLESDFIRCFRAQPPLAFPRGTSATELLRLEKHWWRTLVECVFEGAASPRFDEFFDELFEFFRSSEAWQLYADTVPTLEALKARGLRLGVISNFDSRLDDVLRNLGLARYFEAVYTSSRTGAAKPDPAIFQAALAESRLPPHCALHTGDSLREDAQGAAAAGLHAVWIDRGNRPVEASGLTRITRLDELLQLYRADLTCP